MYASVVKLPPRWFHLCEPSTDQRRVHQRWTTIHIFIKNVQDKLSLPDAHSGAIRYLCIWNFVNDRSFPCRIHNPGRRRRLYRPNPKVRQAAGYSKLPRLGECLTVGSCFQRRILKIAVNEGTYQIECYLFIKFCWSSQLGIAFKGFRTPKFW